MHWAKWNYILDHKCCKTKCYSNKQGDYRWKKMLYMTSSWWKLRKRTCSKIFELSGKNIQFRNEMRKVDFYHTPLGSFPLKTAGILSHLDGQKIISWIHYQYSFKEGKKFSVFILIRNVNCHLKCKWNKLFFDNSWHCLCNWLVHFKCKLGD